MEPSPSPSVSINDAAPVPDIQEQIDLAERMAVGERLARVVAHDLNNIFQSLLVNLQFAEQSARPLPHALTDIRDAQQTTDRALAMAKRLQLFCRSSTINGTSIDLSTWLPGRRESLANRAGQAIAIGVRTADEPCVVKADSEALLECLGRLVDNSSEAMPDGGTFLISAQPVELDPAYCKQHPFEPASRMIMVEARDSGPGMEPDVLRHAFEPFFSSRKDSRGTGFGLAFVYMSLRKMGGFASIASEAGSGTVVRLFIPATSDKPGGAASISSSEASSAGITYSSEPRQGSSQIPARGILVVESDPIVREVASRCLAREGYPVFEAEDGEEAISVYEKHASEIGIVMLEFALPKRSGFEVQGAIRAISPNQRFLFSSSFNSDLRIDAIAEDPRIQLIAKPFTRADLLNTVELMIGRP